MELPFKLIAIDIETTGLDPIKASMIQLGAIVIDRQFNTVEREEFDIYIKPLDSYRTQEAMNVNRISEEQLAQGYSLDEGLELFENFCSKYKNLASWGDFDVSFLKRQYEKINRPYPFSYKTIDLKSIAIWEMAKRDIQLPGNINKFLNELGEDFEGNPHDALDDIKNTVKILQSIKKQYE